MISLLNRHLVQPAMAWRGGSRHLRYYRLLKHTQFDPPSEIQSRQFAAVRRLLSHAYHTVPYYQNLFNKHKIRPDDILSFQDFERIPILTKAELRTNASQLRSTAFLDQSLTRKSTSGSTGMPLEVMLDRDSREWKQACTLRSDEWSGWRLGQRVAKVWGNPEYRHHGFKGRVRNFLIDRARYLDTLDVTEERLFAFASSLRRKPPGLLFGHAHSLYLLAVFVRKHCPGSIQPGGILSTAMLLHDWQRTMIEETFGQRVTNRYGCEEVSLIACECEKQRGLHVNADSLYTEVQQDLNRWPDPNTGKMIVTDLTNYAMPLIRYQIGDVVVKSTRSCGCGRGLPLLERVEGREADYVLTPEGKLISGISLTENFALHIRGAAQVQLVQDDLHHLRVRMVAGDEFGAESRRMVAELVRKTFGPEMRHELELVAEIPQEPSGKYRFCISPVATEYLKALAT